MTRCGRKSSTQGRCEASLSTLMCDLDAPITPRLQSHLHRMEIRDARILHRLALATLEGHWSGSLIFQEMFSIQCLC